jgi:hypothetical protein
LTGQSVNLTGQSVNLTGQSVNLTGQSVNLTGQLVKLTGQSVGQFDRAAARFRRRRGRREIPWWRCFGRSAARDSLVARCRLPGRRRLEFPGGEVSAARSTARCRRRRRGICCQVGGEVSAARSAAARNSLVAMFRQVGGEKNLAAELWLLWLLWLEGLGGEVGGVGEKFLAARSASRSAARSAASARNFLAARSWSAIIFLVARCRRRRRENFGSRIVAIVAIVATATRTSWWRCVGVEVSAASARSSWRPGRRRREISWWRDFGGQVGVGEKFPGGEISAARSASARNVLVARCRRRREISWRRGRGRREISW